MGLNYLDHIEETGASRPVLPTIFNKQSTCVIGPAAAIQKPRISDQVDYEGELGVATAGAAATFPRAEPSERKTSPHAV